MNYVLSYEGDPVDPNYGELVDKPASIILHLNMLNWTLSRRTPVMKYSYEGDAPDIAVIDDTRFISVFDAYLWKGNAVVLEVDLAIKP